MKSTLLFLIVGIIWSQSVFGTTLPSGLWQIECKDGLIKEQVVQVNFVISTEKFYADRQCHRISFIFETRGHIGFTAEQPGWIDFTYAAVSIQVFNSQAVLDLNNRKVCGFNDWDVAKAKDITGLRCALFNVNKETQIPKPNDLKYGIFKIEDNKLFYGQMTVDLNGSTPERRPQIFDFNFYILNQSN